MLEPPPFRAAAGALACGHRGRLTAYAVDAPTGRPTLSTVSPSPRGGMNTDRPNPRVRRLL
eukprot:6341060-Alexandrium_andersonii.AAC.1